MQGLRAVGGRSHSPGEERVIGVSPRQCVRWSVAAYAPGDDGREICAFTTHQLDSPERVLVEYVLAAERPGVARVDVTEHTWRYACRRIAHDDLAEHSRDAVPADTPAGVGETELHYLVATPEADLPPASSHWPYGPAAAGAEEMSAESSWGAALEVTVLRSSRPVGLRDLPPPSRTHIDA